MHLVTMRHMCVMPGFLMIACLVMLGGCSMMLRGVFVVLRRFVVMVDVCIGHGKQPFLISGVSAKANYVISKALA